MNHLNKDAQSQKQYSVIQTKVPIALNAGLSLAESKRVSEKMTQFLWTINYTAEMSEVRELTGKKALDPNLLRSHFSYIASSPADTCVRNLNMA